MFPLEKIGANANIRVIGITGKVSSGKSTLLLTLEKMGFATLSVDNILDNLYKTNEKLKSEVVDALGDAILSNQSLNKHKIAEIVFKNKDMLTTLEKITTPYVLEEIRSVAKGLKKPLAVEFPLLFELGLEKLFDTTIFVDCDDQLCKERSSVSFFDERLKRQLSDKQKRSLATLTISNKGPMDDFVQTIKSSIKGLS